MELQYFGANCTRILTKKASIIIDDNLGELGLKQQAKAGDIVVFTGAHGDLDVDSKIVIDRPGEYEISGVSIIGLAARAHMDEEGSKTATIFKLVSDDIRILVTGHVYPDLSEEQLETIGLVDIIIIPVGGNGYTLDGVGALKIIKQIEPKVIIPVHYADKAINYPVPQQDLKSVLQNMGIESKQTIQKLKIKNTEVPEGTELITLERQ